MLICRSLVRERPGCGRISPEHAGGIPSFAVEKMTALQHHTQRAEWRPSMSRRGWIALGGAAVVVIVVIIGVVSANHAGSPSAAPNASPSTSLPDLGGPRSGLVPEMTLPVGARPYTGKHPAPPGFEFWEVPGSRHDLVTQLRSELPTFAPLNGMPWCGEVVDHMTSWAWGTAADVIGVSFTDGGVMIRRFAEPGGCHP